MFKVRKDALHITWENLRDKIEADQVVIRAVLSHFSVRSTVIHLTQPAAFHQAILLKWKLTLGNMDKIDASSDIA